MGKSRDLSEFERGMIVGARSAGCSISETVNLLGFSKTAVSRVYREWRDKQKTSSHRGSCGRKRLVDDSGEKRMESVVEANNHATNVQIQALYNSSGQEKPISLTTTRRTLKRLGYSRRAPRRDTLVLAGLDALAAYTSCVEPLHTSTDKASNNENDSEPRGKSSKDLVSTENDSEPRVETCTDLVSTENDSEPRVKSSTDLVSSTEKDSDQRVESPTDPVCCSEKDPDT